MGRTSREYTCGHQSHFASVGCVDKSCFAFVGCTSREYTSGHIFLFTDFGGSSFIALEGAVFTSKGEFYFFSVFAFFYGGVACSVLPRTFPAETLPDFLLRFGGSSTIDLEGVLFYALCLGREC